jgi:hypothetical protein
MKAWLTLVIFATLAACATHESPVNPATDRWGRVRFLLGTWTGEASGESGKATVTRTYKLAPDGQFIDEQSTTRFEATAGGKREVRHQIGSISYDKDRKTFMLRQAPSDIGNDEGLSAFVYALNTDKSMAEYLIFDTVATENSYNNVEARANYDVISPNEFVEIIETGKDLVEHGRIHFKRKK